jgi:hypothetical protein
MFVWFIPAAAAGQTAAESTDREESGRLSIHVAGGPLISSGSVVSAAFGFSPTSRLRLLLNVERDRLPFESKNIDGGTSITRGGTLTFASGEVRVLILSATRVSPFAMVAPGPALGAPPSTKRFLIRSKTTFESSTSEAVSVFRCAAGSACGATCGVRSR